MELIIFCGIQATGKSTFYKERFFNSHARISMDLYNTRNKESLFFTTCLQVQQAMVIDNTNPTIAEREKYIAAAKEKKYKVIGYYFQSVMETALKRNLQRIPREQIPEVGIKGTYAKLELPSWAEGFDELYYVAIESNGFTIKKWADEV